MNRDRYAIERLITPLIETQDKHARDIERLQTRPIAAQPWINIRPAGGVTDYRARVQTAIAGIPATGGVVYFSPGDYPITSVAGSGLSATSIVIDSPNVTVLGARGARIIAQNGSHNRLVLVRDTTDVTIDGLEVVYDRADAAAANGIVIENSSRVTVRNCTIDSFSVYGIAVNENTETSVGAACNDIEILDNHLLSCGYFGIEVYPKVMSRNLIVRGNTAYDCGHELGSGGAGIKAGAGYVNALITENTTLHCIIGFAIGAWWSTTFSNNKIINSYTYGIGITNSEQSLISGEEFDTLSIHGNTIAFTDDVISGANFNPAATNTIDASRPVYGNYGAININGLRTESGLIDIAGNTIHRTSQGLTFSKSLVGMSGVVFRDNTIIDAGISWVDELTITGDTTSGSAVITNIASTTGWLAGAQVQGAGIPAGAVVLSLTATTLTLDMNATATATGVALSSGHPPGLIVKNNVFRDTRGASATGLILFFSAGGVFENNTIDGFMPYALQLKGDKQIVRNNTFRKINQVGTASRSPILVNAPGTYYILDNIVDNSEAGSFDYIVRTGSLGTTATAVMRGNRSTTTLTGLSNGLASVRHLDGNDFNVMHFGAKGDGTTDDTAAIQAAIDAAVVVGGGIVSFPAGDYVLASSLNIVATTSATPKLGIMLVGAGARHNVNYETSPTTLIYTGTGSYALKVDGNWARNFGMRDIGLSYNNAGFSGNVLDIGDTLIAGCSFERVYFGGPGVSAATDLFTANACVKANCAEFFTFDQCYFTEAQFGYLGGSVQQSGITFRDCVFGDLSVAQVRSIAVQGLAWRFDGCNFDPIRIAPQYGVDLACNGFLFTGCNYVGVSSTVAPSVDFLKLTGRGKIDGGYMSTVGTGIRLAAGGVYEVSGGIRISAAAPVIVEGGVFVEHAVDYVVVNSGTAAVDIVPGTLAAASIRCGPSRFAESGATAYSYRTVQKSSSITGRIAYSATQDATTNKHSLFTGSRQYIELDELTFAGPKTLVKEGTFANEGVDQTVGIVPAGSIITDIWINVEAAYNDTGSDFISVGVTGSSRRYGNVDASATGLTKLTTLLPEFRPGDTTIVSLYNGANNDATLGRHQVVVRFQAIT